jgi:hypothetical protein
MGVIGMEKGYSTELVTLPEAQRRTGLGLRQFRRAIETGALAVFDVGGWPRLRWRDVLAWIESNRRGHVAQRPCDDDAS